MCDSVCSQEMKPCLKKEFQDTDANEELTKKDSFKMSTSNFCEKLTTSVLSLYVDDMKKATTSLSELTKNQSIVVETLEQENIRVNEALNTYPLEEMFSRLKLYHHKAQQLKKDMVSIHERTSKLKKRAMKLQQQKQKEALQKELQKDRDIERDKLLAPKIVTK